MDGLSAQISVGQSTGFRKDRTAALIAPVLDRWADVDPAEHSG